MKTFLSIAVLAVVLFIVNANITEPKVQVYSRNPGEFGKPNVLICHVSGFHPPDITIVLLDNDSDIPNAKQSDISFEHGWQFHLTKSAAFTPQAGHTYSCRVRHVDKTKKYIWEPDM